MKVSEFLCYFLDTGIRKLVPRYQKCVAVRGDYVEK
jgi:hypothetical protein